jgi:hypothetical protein
MFNYRTPQQSIVVPKKFAKLMGEEVSPYKVVKRGPRNTPVGKSAAKKPRRYISANSAEGNYVTLEKGAADPPVVTFVDQLRRLTETMMHSLEIFRKKHGHCAVPPDDSLAVAPSAQTTKDTARLADWCSLQRQIYRQIWIKYREATDEESKLIVRLNALGFCWDYEAWHWEESFRLTQEEKELCDATKQGLSDQALAWVRDQRRRYKRGMDAYPSDRAKKLKTMEVIVI